MLRSYLLALAAGSSLDQTVHNFTLFNLIDTLAVPPEQLGQVLSIELHVYLLVEPEARERDLELRLVRVRDGGQADPGDPLPFRTGSKARFRLRIGAFRLPHEYGEYRLHIEWRAPGEETWHPDGLEWPLTVSPAPAPDAQPAELP